jgi:hypothetical protein
MLILWRRTVPGRKAAMGYPIPWCSRNGSPEYALAILQLRSHCRRTNLKLGRADVTSNEEKSVENSPYPSVSVACGRTISVEKVRK